MIPVYSVVKIRPLTDEELESIEGQSGQYLNENVDSTGIKFFYKNEMLHYPELLPFARGAGLYFNELNLDNLKRYFKIPEEYVDCKIRCSDDKKFFLLSFEDVFQHKIEVESDRFEIKRLITRAYDRYSVVHIEPIYNMGSDYAAYKWVKEYIPRGYLKDEERADAGYYNISNSSIADTLPIDKHLLETHIGEAIFFHTYESIKYKKVVMRA